MPETSVRIIIDIKDITDFDWERATGFWKVRMKSKNLGYNDDMEYIWYKVNPNNNMPITPLSRTAQNRCVGIAPGQIVDADKSESAAIRDEIDALRRAIYQLKAEKSNKDPTYLIKAMEGNLRKLYSRWAALDVTIAEGGNLVFSSDEMDNPVKAAKSTRKKKESEPMILAGDVLTPEQIRAIVGKI